MDRKQLQQAVVEAQASIQMQAQQQLSERMSSICFKRCITSPTDKLADRQRRCLDQCIGGFMEGFGVAVRFFIRCSYKSSPLHYSMQCFLLRVLITSCHHFVFLFPSALVILYRLRR